MGDLSYVASPLTPDEPDWKRYVHQLAPSDAVNFRYAVSWRSKLKPYDVLDLVHLKAVRALTVRPVWVPDDNAYLLTASTANAYVREATDFEIALRAHPTVDPSHLLGGASDSTYGTVVHHVAFQAVQVITHCYQTLVPRRGPKVWDGHETDPEWRCSTWLTRADRPLTKQPSVAESDTEATYLTHSQFLSMTDVVLTKPRWADWAKYVIGAQILCLVDYETAERLGVDAVRLLNFDDGELDLHAWADAIRWIKSNHRVAAERFDEWLKNRTRQRADYLSRL